MSMRKPALLLVTVGLCAGSLWGRPPAAAPLAEGQAPAETTIALTGARLLDGTGGAPIEPATLVVRNGRVDAVGPADRVVVPDGATRIEARGKTIIPGLINAHGHVAAIRDSPLPLRDQLVAQLRMYAQYGVTTVVSLGDDGVETVRLRDEQEDGVLDRARLYPSGPNVTARTVEEARETVDQVAAMGVSIIKTRVDGPDDSPARMAPDVYGAIIDQAHRHGLRVAAHMYYLKDARGLLDAGADVLAHSVRDQDVDEALIADLQRSNVGYIPTLARDLSVFVYETTPAFFSDQFFLRGRSLYGAQMAQLTEPASQEAIRNDPDAQAIKGALEQAQRNLERLAAGGVPIAMGTDTGANLIGRWQGFFEHTELELMAEAGLTPAQILHAATGGAADVMQLDELGTLEPGQWADFVVLNADPLADIANTQQIDAVWIGGHRLTP